MIAAQRRAHYFLWRALAPLVLAGLVIAVAARLPRPQGPPVEAPKVAPPAGVGAGP